MMDSTVVAVESKVTRPLPPGQSNAASITPSTLITATRAAVAQLAQVIPVTASETTLPLGGRSAWA